MPFLQVLHVLLKILVSVFQHWHMPSSQRLSQDRRIKAECGVFAEYFPCHYQYLTDTKVGYGEQGRVGD